MVVVRFVPPPDVERVGNAWCPWLPDPSDPSCLEVFDRHARDERGLSSFLVPARGAVRVDFESRSPSGPPLFACELPTWPARTSSRPAVGSA